MTHTSIKLNTPCEFVNIVPFNPLISKCHIKVCWVGQEPNRNGSIITKEVATEMANSLPGSPIVGYFNKQDKDFEGHNRSIEIENGEIKFVDTTKPYGFVDLNAKVWFQKFLDDGADEREYLMTEGWLWTGQYPECQRVIDEGNNQSMELDKKLTNGSWTKTDNENCEFFIINEAIMSKLCILGEDVEPCFEGSNIETPKYEFSFNEEFKNQLFSMINEIKEFLSEGGKAMTENENVVVEETVVEEPEVVVKEPVTETEPTAESEEPVASYNLEEVVEYQELLSQFNELQTNFEALTVENEQLKQDNEALTSFKHGVEKEKKEAMIASFYMLSDQDKKDVIDNIDTYSIDEIEAKLSIICVRNKVNFNHEDETNNNSDPAPTSYNLNDVEEEDSAIPAWIKLLNNIANN